ncbi:MAG: hypothetical protein ABIV25_03615, partial [Paracoccaceae bacterium]
KIFMRKFFCRVGTLAAGVCEFSAKIQGDLGGGSWGYQRGVGSYELVRLGREGKPPAGIFGKR